MRKMRRKRDTQCLPDAARRGSTAEHGDDAGYFSSIGLPESVGWYVSAALYWIASMGVLTIERATHGSAVNDTVGILATITLALTPLLVLGARYMPHVKWGPYVRITLPFIILAIGAAAIGDALDSMILITMFPILAVAYLHEWKISLPYCLLAIGSQVWALGTFETSDDKWTRIVVLAGSLTAVTGGLIFAQQRVRKAADANLRLSVTDPLTGLANLRRLQSRLAHEIRRSSRDGSRIVLFAIDLDDFKIVNDRYSYELGDAVLRAVANALADTMHPGDLLVRRGGDEFAVLTLHTPDRNLKEFREEIAAAIVQARLTVCPEVNPQASVTYLEHRSDETTADFLRRLDDSLHETKLDAHPDRRAAEAAARQAGQNVEHVHVFSDGAELEDELSTGQARSQTVGRQARRADNRVAWNFIIASSLVPPALLGGAAWSGLATGLAGEALDVCIFGSVLCAAIAFYGRQRGLRLRWINLPLAGSLALITAAIWQAGDSRPALLELYAIQPPLAVYLLRRANALPYLGVSITLYTYFLIASSYENSAIRIVMFTGILTVLFLMLVRGQSAVREYSRVTAELSVVDPLTGVGNLRGLRRRVEDEIARCRLTGDGVALMVVDLDGFKFVNDRFSHSLGDAVLVESARAIAATVREDELVARRGGDEFAVVCSPEAHADVGALAERIAASVSEARARLTSGVPTGATVRYILWDGTEPADEFMRRADVELHDAKALRDGGANGPSNLLSA